MGKLIEVVGQFPHALSAEKPMSTKEHQIKTNYDSFFVLFGLLRVGGGLGCLGMSSPKPAQEL